MGKEIKAEGRSLAKIFNPDFEFNIPHYQRPYSWTTEHTSNLFNDLYDFYRDSQTDDYFLGSIVLIEEEGKRKVDVIDGQQRLTTLTILFACLAYQVGKIAKNKADYEYQDELLKVYILERGIKSQKIDPKPRLNIRQRDRNFFANYIHTLDFDSLLEIDPKQLDNESQELIQNNSRYLINKIKKTLSEDMVALQDFLVFLATKCFLVAISAPDKLTASNVFSVMNTRGLNLQTTDIIKADVMGETDSNDFLNKAWEDMEQKLGREDFNNLFIYVRMIFAQKKAKKSILEEFKNYVSDGKDAATLINDILEPHSDSLSTIRSCDYKATSVDDAKAVNYYLTWLGRIENSDWLPLAIKFLSQNKNESSHVVHFFQKLERLSAYLYICGRSRDIRIERYASVIGGLEGDYSLQNPPQNLDLTTEEKQEMLKVLSNNVYKLPAQKKSYIIHRLDSFMAGPYINSNIRNLTIEHVLPQNPDKDSKWLEQWKDEQRDEWLHKLANLALLNRTRNAQARNYEFEKKKSFYFSGNTNLSPTSLTVKAWSETEWTPDVLERRQGELLEVFKKEECWGLA